jgi:hypothetical protein
MVKKKVGFVLAIVFLVAAISASAYTGWYTYLYFRYAMLLREFGAWGAGYYLTSLIIGVACTITFWILFGNFRKYNPHLK